MQMVLAAVIAAWGEKGVSF